MGGAVKCQAFSLGTSPSVSIARDVEITGSEVFVLLKTGAFKTKDYDERFIEDLLYGIPPSANCETYQKINSASICVQLSYGVEARTGLEWINTKKVWEINDKNNLNFRQIKKWLSSQSVFDCPDHELDGFPVSLFDLLSFKEWAPGRWGLDIPALRDFLEIVIPPNKSIKDLSKIKPFSLNVSFHVKGTRTERRELVSRKLLRS